MKNSSALFTTAVVVLALLGGLIVVHNDHLKTYRETEDIPSPDVFDLAQGALTSSHLIPPTCVSYEARKSLLVAFKDTAPAWLTKVPNVLNAKPEKYDFPTKKFDCVADLTLAVSPEEADHYDKYVEGNEFATAEFPFIKSLEALSAIITRDEQMAADYLMHDKIKKKEIQLVKDGDRNLLTEKIHYSVVDLNGNVQTDYLPAEIKAYSKLLDKIHRAE